MSDSILREQIANFLRGQQAHMSFEEAIKDFPPSHINEVFPNGTYTFWHLLEHIRFTQKDILDFIKDPKYKEPHWPEDYWPKKSAKATPKEWNATIKSFQNDLQSLIDMVQDGLLDLSAKVPNGTDQTYLREFLMVVDHNSYHIGEFAIMRQVLDIWK